MNAIHATPAIPPRQQTRRTLSAAKVYAFYEAMHAAAQGRHRSLGGSLLLYEGLDEDGRMAALAGNIAGVATLGIDPNLEELKQAVNEGVCDFLVNNLDEALRILKNEVRKKQPVSVCLRQDFASAVAEMVERGVQPDFLSSEHPTVAAMRARGAIAVLPREGQGSGVNPVVGVNQDIRVNQDMGVSPAIGATAVVGVSWTASAAPALWLPKIDALAASVVDPGDEQRPDHIRKRWLRYASRYLGRLTGGMHYLPMTSGEAEEFRRVVEEKVADQTIGCAVRITMEPATQILI